MASQIVELRVSKAAIQTLLAALPHASYPQAHDALRATLQSPAPFVEVQLARPFAIDLLEWLKQAAARLRSEHARTVPELVEIADSLQIALDRRD